MATPVLISTDTSPTLTAIITRDDTMTPLDLTGCTVFFQLRLVDDSRFVVNAVCSITNASAGAVSYTLSDADLDFDGACLARFLVIFADLKRQHTTPAIAVTVAPQ